MKKLIIVGALLILIAAGVFGYIDSDNFNRANNNDVEAGEGLMIWSEVEDFGADVRVLNNEAYLDKNGANVWLKRALINNWTNISFMFRTSSTTQQSDIRIGNGAGGDMPIYIYTLNGDLNCHTAGVGLEVIVAMTDDVWYHINISNVDKVGRWYNITVNGTEYGCEMFTGNTWTNISFLNLGTGVTYFDDYIVVNETNPFASVPPVVTIEYPTESTSYNTSWNGSIVLSTDITANCSINYTTNSLISNLTQHTFNLSSTPDGNYTVSYACNNTDQWTNSSFWFSYDGTYPTLSLSRPGNGTTQFGDFNISVAFYDDYLYATNVTIHNSTSHLVYWNSSGAITDGRNNWTINELFNTSLQVEEVEQYTAFFEATDSHTKTYWDEKLNYTKDEDDPEFNQLEYNLSRGDITIEYPKDMDIQTYKDTDRFILEFHSTVIRGETAFNIQAPKMVYLPGSDYQGHFVIYGKDGRPYYWFDTEGLEMTRIEEIKPNKYRIYFIQDEDYETSRSLGGLNYINWTTTFTVNIGDGRADIVQSGAILQGYANISKPKTTFEYAWFKDGVNISSGNYTNNETDRVIVNNYTLLDIGSYIFSVRSWNGSHYTTWINSSAHTIGYITALFYDEDSLSVFDYSEITAELIGVNINYSEVKKTTNGTVVFDGFSLINDTQYEIRYYAADHTIRSAFLDLSTFGNVSRDLYLLNDSISDKLDVVVRDFSLIGIPNATITVQRYYANLSAWLSVAQGRTNVLGYTRQYVDKDDVYYRFIIEYVGTTIYQTSGEIITADTTVYRITTDISSVYTSWVGIEGEISYSNATGTATFSFVYENKASNIEDVNLEVYQQEDEGGSTSLVATNTSTATDNTITIILPDPLLYHVAIVRLDYTDGESNYIEGYDDYTPPPPADKEDFRPFILLVYLVLFPALILGGFYVSKRLISVPVTVVICSAIAHFNPLWTMFPLWTFLIILFGAFPIGWYLNKVNV